VRQVRVCAELMALLQTEDLPRSQGCASIAWSPTRNYGERRAKKGLNAVRPPRPGYRR
jgi:hypothetical protein